ncbi:amidohydrolase [bacterium]|nr:amidohydrolase [bacterium]
MCEFLNDQNRRRLIEWRRDFHAHPELAYQENRTAGIVAAHLRQCGYEVKTAIGRTGVVGVMAGKPQGKTLMLRADMDCLPVQEENDTPYKSVHEGRMHACGHDGHTAILMAVAEHLQKKRQTLQGTAKLVFQPAEEGGNGSERMIQDGVLLNPQVDAAFGLHLWNDKPIGKIALNPGALMAGVHSFDLTIHGKGGHGAAPHQTIDTIVASAQVINNLQTIVSRNVDPLETAVVTVASIHSGSAFNVIAETASLKGTVRYFSRALGEQLPLIFERIVSGTTQSLGATYSLKYEKLTPPTINDPRMAEFIREVASEVVGSENVIMDARTMGGEDMSFFLNEVPGCFFFVGSRNEQQNLIYPHHSPKFDFDEAAMEIGVEVLCRAAEKFLS